MRYVQILVPDGQLDAVLETLRERDIDYHASSGDVERGDRTMVSFPIPTDAVEHVLDDLYETGLDSETYMVVTTVEFAMTEHMNELQNRYSKTPNRLAPAELRSKAKDLAPNTRAFTWMMFLSAVVAAAGLLIDSPAVVVGSMVIAPIVSPALTATVGAIRNDREMFVDSLWMQGLGLAIAVVGALAFAMLTKMTGFTPQALAVSDLELVSLRLSPGFLSLGVGLAAGAAATYGLATKGSTTIVGVMIAAALIPTAATVGVALAWNALRLAAGALLLLVVNVIAINVTGFLMLAYLDYRPDSVDEGLLTLGSSREALVLVATVVVALALVLGTGAATYEQLSFERQTTLAVEETLGADAYADLDTRSVDAQYRTLPLVSGQPTVTVTVTRTTDRDHAALPGELERRIEERTGTPVSVRVRYVDYQTPSVSAAPLRTGAPTP